MRVEALCSVHECGVVHFESSSLAIILLKNRDQVALILLRCVCLYFVSLPRNATAYNLS